MDKQKQESLELAISAYNIESASEVFEMIENKKIEDIRQSVTKDYFTLLPTKHIKKNTFIQIIGTECPNIFMVWTLEPNQTDGMTNAYTAHEVNQFFRKKKIEGIL